MKVFAKNHERTSFRLIERLREIKIFIFVISYVFVISDVVVFFCLFFCRLLYTCILEFDQTLNEAEILWYWFVLFFVLFFNSFFFIPAEEMSLWLFRMNLLKFAPSFRISSCKVFLLLPVLVGRLPVRRELVKKVTRAMVKPVEGS